MPIEQVMLSSRPSTWQGRAVDSRMAVASDADWSTASLPSSSKQELVAAQPAPPGAVAPVAASRLGNAPEHPVTRLVAEVVVDQLEAGPAQYASGRPGVRCGVGLTQYLRHGALEAAPRRQPCQAVAITFFLPRRVRAELKLLRRRVSTAQASSISSSSSATPIDATLRHACRVDSSAASAATCGTAQAAKRPRKSFDRQERPRRQSIAAAICLGRRLTVGLSLSGNATSSANAKPTAYRRTSSAPVAPMFHWRRADRPTEASDQDLSYDCCQAQMPPHPIAGAATRMGLQRPSWPRPAPRISVATAALISRPGSNPTSSWPNRVAKVQDLGRCHAAGQCQRRSQSASHCARPSQLFRARCDSSRAT